MRRAIFDRDIAPGWKGRLLTEIAPDDLRALCLQVKERGAPATAIHVRDIVKQIFGYAILHGEKITNPADEVGPSSIATFTPKDRSLTPTEIRLMLRELEHVPTLPTIRLGLRLILLTMVRKSELLDAVWDEVDFSNAVWTIPKGRMKRRKAHNVYLSRQSLDIMIALKTCAGNSLYVLPSRYDADAPMSRATFMGAPVNQRSPKSPKVLASLSRRLSRCFSSAGERPSDTIRRASIQSSLARESGMPSSP
jgi:integrase